MARMTTRRQSQPPIERIEPFLGVDFNVSQTQIDRHRSPDMKNFIIGSNGDLVKRTGYKKVFPFSLGTGKINGMFQFTKSDGTTVFLFAHQNNLYELDELVTPITVNSGAVDLGMNGTRTLTPIYTGLANNDVNAFTMSDKCYMMDGTNYLVYDGTTISKVEDNPYIPTLTIVRAPNGGGTLYEDFNMLGSGFKEQFSGDGTSAVYQLSLTDLDSTLVTANVDGVDKVETTDFTVDRTLGTVTFTTIPADGTDNVIITAYKTFPDKPIQITNCTFFSIFGGSQDTRVFFSGNKNMPKYIWRSGLEDPSYAPENGFYKLHDDVVGFEKQYDFLVVEQKNSKTVIDFQLNGGDVSFPERPINDEVGTLARKTIQLLDNNPVSLNQKGVYMLTSTTIRTEQNVRHISQRVDPKLLKEPNLENAISVDFDRKYWLAVNGNVYIYDYTIDEWYIFDNIHASCFLEINGYLYFGSDTEGMIYRFMYDTEDLPYRDDGSPIVAYWFSKRLSFGASEYWKMVEKLFTSMKPSPKTSCDIYYVTDKEERTLLNTESMNLFSYTLMDYSFFTYATHDFLQESVEKVKTKKIVYFQLEIRNEKLDENLGINSIGIKYLYQSLVK